MVPQILSEWKWLPINVAPHETHHRLFDSGPSGAKSNSHIGWYMIMGNLYLINPYTWQGTSPAISGWIMNKWILPVPRVIIHSTPGLQPLRKYGTFTRGAWPWSFTTPDSLDTTLRADGPSRDFWVVKSPSSDWWSLLNTRNYQKRSSTSLTIK